ncbi:hypothetical protein GCM10023238_24570 [Streptomyces heliomycini]
MFMQSNGGLTEAGRFRGKDAVLSAGRRHRGHGPHVAARRLRPRHRLRHGRHTSTDVSHYAGEYERVVTTRIAGSGCVRPCWTSTTVAAAAARLVLHFVGSRYRVGPDSAAPDPGPACYRRGGPAHESPTPSSCSAVSSPPHFPAVFARTRPALDDALVRDRSPPSPTRSTKQTGDDRTPSR